MPSRARQVPGHMQTAAGLSVAQRQTSEVWEPLRQGRALPCKSTAVGELRGAPGRQEGVLGKLHLCRPVRERPEEGEEASACPRSQQLGGLPAAYRRGLPEPGLAALGHHLAEVLIFK